MNTTVLLAMMSPQKKEKAMGSLYKRGGTWWVKYYRNGKAYRESAKSGKEAHARRLLKRREGEIADGKLPGIYFDRVTYDELEADFLVDYKVNGKKSLSETKERVKKNLTPFFSGMRVVDITTSEVNKYIKKRLDNEAAHATINRELSALKRMLRLGATQTPPKVDRVPHIPMLTENNVREGFFDYDLYTAVRGALPAYLQPIATFAYKTGWRKSEILKLTWDRVDLHQGTVRLETRETKNAEARTIYLDDELKDIFIGLWNERKQR
jgi:integrase